MQRAFRLLLFTLVGAILLVPGASGAAGDLFEADFSSGNIYRFAADGTKSLYTAGFSGVEGLAFDTAGNLFASATGPGVIHKFATNGNEQHLRERFEWTGQPRF